MAKRKEVGSLTCKAAVCWGGGEPLKIEMIEVEPPRASEVRVKMLCASLCHTDILCWKGTSLLGLFPRVLGHEGVGIVESVGEEVTELREGDYVIPTLVGECQKCGNCTSGKTNLCLQYPLNIQGLMLDNTSRMSIKGQKLYNTFGCSTWSEFTVMNVSYVLKIDSKVPPQHASFISCGYSTGFGAAWKEAKVEKGSTVAVFGLGGVGLGVVEGARSGGAQKIICIDINETKKEKGEMFGMTDFINPKKLDKSISEVIKEMTGGLGVDYSFECTGAAPLVSEAFEAVIPGRGLAVVIGAGEEPIVSVNLMSLMSGKTLKGSIFGGIKPKSDLPIIVDKCANKELQLDELVTHKVNLDDINQAFDILKEPDCLKVVIQISTNLSS